jgi:hypothetical protein
MQNDMQNYLQKPFRIFWLVALGVLGVIPLVLAISWVNGNMTLPGEIHRLFQEKFSWPWLSFEESALPVRATLDLVFSVAVYGIILLVQRLKHPQIRRAALVTALGLALFSVMSLWQYTGVILWAFRVPFLLEDILYYGLVLLSALLALRGQSIWAVIGFSQLYEQKREAIAHRDMFSRRGFLPLLLAFYLTNTMSLDRLIFCGVTTAFLIFFLKPYARDSSKGI